LAPDVVLRKLEVLRRLVADLEPFAGASEERVAAEHYKLERILELLVTASADLLQHLLAESEVVAGTYREVFRLAGEGGLLPRKLASRLERAAGMRNILVHLYAEIDLGIVRASIAPALADFRELIVQLAPFAGSPDGDSEV
jgi:uncharacterized protein YutE (UPF0331/DUF86 family)